MSFALSTRAVFEAISLEKGATESWAYWTATAAASGPSCERRFKSERKRLTQWLVLVRGCRVWVDSAGLRCTRLFGHLL